jgi:hypothetical protein
MYGIGNAYLSRLLKLKAKDPGRKPGSFAFETS